MNDQPDHLVTVDGVPIKEYMEAILVEKDRALEMADDERERAASALRGEQQRALDQAEREREKAASNLREELARAIKEGDDRLREHIMNQVHQIREALISAEKLELERVGGALERLAGVQREVNLQADASKEAILKAEAASEVRFASVNEFRAQLGDQTKTFLPRETFDAFIASFAEYKEATNRALILREGTTQGARDSKQQQGVTVGYFFGGLGALGVIVGLIVALSQYTTG